MSSIDNLFTDSEDSASQCNNSTMHKPNQIPSREKAASKTKYTPIDNGIESSMSKTDLFGSTTSSIPGNLHYCSDKQIAKLINKNGSINLIKQLSNDLSIREAELILLRKEKTLVETELKKLLNEYGNLSTIEIEKKLSLIKLDKNVNNVLKDLISNAMDEQIDDSSIVKIQPKPLRKPSGRDQVYGSEDTSLINSSFVTTASENNDGTKSNKETSSRNGSIQLSRDLTREETNSGKLKSSWLGNWFISTDDLQSQISHINNHNGQSSKPNSHSTNAQPIISPSRPHSLSLPTFKPGSVYSRVPVELESIVPQKSQPPIFSNNTSSKIDKYGFFVDGGSLKKRNGNKINHSENNEGKDKDSEENDDGDKEEGTDGFSLRSHQILSNDDLRLKLKSIGDLDDTRNKQIEAKWDEFFKNLNNDYYNHFDKNSILINDDMLGLKGLNLLKLANLNSNQNHYAVFTRLSNFGIPMKYRSKIWFECSGAKNKKIPGEFTNILNNYEININDSVQINLDLNRTMPYNIFFNDLINNEPGPGLAKLNQILVAFCKKNPEIGYCQGMNKIIAIFLLIYSNEEDVFWLFQSLIDNILPKYFFVAPLIHVRIDQIILKKLFAKILPNLSKHFNKLGVEIEIITFNWFLSIFSENCLPIEILFKIYDNLIIFGEIKLFSISLSIFKIFEKNLLTLNDINDVYLVMKNLINNGNLNIKFDNLIQTSIEFERFFNMEFVNEQRSIEWSSYLSKGYI